MSYVIKIGNSYLGKDGTIVDRQAEAARFNDGDIRDARNAGGIRPVHLKVKTSSQDAIDLPTDEPVVVDASDAIKV